MKLYKCDGKRFKDGKECTNTIEVHSEEERPKRWLTIEGHLQNGLNDAHTITRNGLSHFCSESCLIMTLFKKENL